jgi:hypothetical protein
LGDERGVDLSASIECGLLVSAVGLRLLIQAGDVEGIRRALESDRGLANQSVHWYLNQSNESDPLHFVSDCVGQGWLTNGAEGEIAALLLAYGAEVDGSEGRESPLIASASLGAERVSSVLIRAGAALEATSLFGARAVHWASWVGAARTVQLLIAHGAEIEARCTEFGATPLFWAVHGYGPNGPRVKRDQIGAARLLLEAGAELDTRNKHGLSVRELASTSERTDMRELLDEFDG